LEPCVAEPVAEVTKAFVGLLLFLESGQQWLQSWNDLIEWDQIFVDETQSRSNSRPTEIERVLVLGFAD
jgi:hypothetical protein